MKAPDAARAVVLIADRTAGMNRESVAHSGRDDREVRNEGGKGAEERVREGVGRGVDRDREG